MRIVGIDPATNTGVVILDATGQPIGAAVLTGKGEYKPGGITQEQRISLENQIYSILRPGDVVTKEGIGHATEMLITTAKIHGGLEGMITRRGLEFDEVAPNAVKKFVNVSGWVGEPGSKQRLKGKAKKEAMAAAALEHFGYSNPRHGKEVEMVLVETFDVNEKLYALLLERENPGADGVILRMEEENEEMVLYNIEDEEEWNAVEAAYNELVAAQE